MKLRFRNTVLVTAAGLALLAGSALAQSADPAASATRSISVVATPTTPAEAPKAAGGDKTADLSKETPEDNSAAKALPPIPTELSGTDKDKSSVVLTPAPGAEAAKPTATAATPPPEVEAGKGKVVAAPVADAGKDKAVVVPPPPAKVVRPKIADVEVAPNIRPRQRQFDRHEHSGRFSGAGDHCQHAGY